MKVKFENTLEGKFITLKKTTLEDAPLIYNWRTSSSGEHMRHPENYSLKMQEEWIKSRGENEINYIIIDKKNNDKVGTISIYEVNEADRVANVGRLLLDEKYFNKSTPYGLEALLLTYEYLFDKMNFRKMTGDILATNIAMYKLQVFLGMNQEGYLKRHVLINGKEHDLYIMSILKEDFEKYYKPKIFFLLRNFK